MNYRILTALIMIIIVLPTVVYADSPRMLSDFAKVTSNQQFVFVLLARDDDRSNYNQAAAVKEDPKLRLKYQQSGLYRNDGSSTPLWTIDWNTFDVDVSSDGHHLVRWGPWPDRWDFDELAVAFYQDGQEIRRYSVNDLVAQPRSLPESMSHYRWLKTTTFDDATSTVTLQTLTGEHYVFDVRTGLPVSGTLPSRVQPTELLPGVIFVLLALTGLIIMVYRLFQRHRASAR